MKKGIYGERQFEQLKHVISLTLQESVKQGAQDILLIEGERPAFRIKGKIGKVSGLPRWTIGVFDVFLGRVYGDDGRVGLFDAIVRKDGGSQNFNLSLLDSHLRCHVYTAYPNGSKEEDGKTFREVRAVMHIRVVPKEMPRIETLNLPDISPIFNIDKGGLFLVSGKTGDGKSTSVASIVNEFNRKTDKKRIIITIEDPVEFVHESHNAWIIQRRVGDDTESYERATADALREDADIVVIGELRTAEELQNALQLAMVGKLVISTIHANGVVDTIERYVNAFQGSMQEQIRTNLMENLLGILHQNLITTEENQYPLASMMLVPNEEIRSELRENRTRDKLESMMRQGDKRYFRTREDGVNDLIIKGVINSEDKQKYI